MKRLTREEANKRVDLAISLMDRDLQDLRQALLSMIMPITMSPNEYFGDGDYFISDLRPAFSIVKKDL